MLQHRRTTWLGAVLSGLLLCAPASAGAKEHSVRIKLNGKSRTITGPVKIQAVLRGRPQKVTFAIDGQRRYVSRSEPFRFGGEDGQLDPSALKDGAHRITVRAYFQGGRKVAKATTLIRVRRKHTTP